MIKCVKCGKLIDPTEDGQTIYSTCRECTPHNYQGLVIALLIILILIACACLFIVLI